MLQFILGGCGTGKSTRLMDEIVQAVRQEETVCLLVPEQFSFEAEKKLYDHMGPEDFNRLQTFSFATLARHILRFYGKNARMERYATEPEKLVYLQYAANRVADRGDLEVFEKRSLNADLIQQLCGVITKIRKAGVDHQRLLDASLAMPEQLGKKVRDIANILFEYDTVLHQHGLCDGLVNLTEAAAIANMQDFFKDKRVFLDEFDSFTGDQYQMLESILMQAKQVTIAIRTDEPYVRSSVIFEGGNATCRKLRELARKVGMPKTEITDTLCTAYVRSPHADLRAVSMSILRPKTVKTAYEGHIHITELSDPAMEAEYVCATICRLLSEHPQLHCRNIVVAVKDAAASAPTLERAFARYALPCTISVPHPILHTELVRYLLALLELLAEPAWRTETVLRYLKTPFAGYETVDVSMLEHFCFTQSIQKEDWLQPFCGANAAQDEIAAKHGGKQLEETRARFVEEIQSLQEACRERKVRDVIRTIYQHLCEKRTAQEERLEAMDTLEQRAFVTLWNLLTEILDTVVSSFGEETFTMTALYEMLMMLIRNTDFSTPPQTLDSVEIVEARTARLNRPAVLFLLGVNENVFPGEIGTDGFFSQQDLKTLQEQQIEISRLFPELYSDERLIVNKMVSAPSEALYLTCPRTNLAAEAVKPSAIIAQIRGLFPAAKELWVQQEDLPLRYFVWTYEAAYYHFVRNLHRNHGELAALRDILLEEPLYAAKLAVLLEEQEAPDYTVAPDIMLPLLGKRLYLRATEVEAFYSCPFQYFNTHCLDLYIPEQNAFTPQNVGNLAHFCFEHILRSCTVQQFAAMTEAQLLGEIERLAKQFSAANFSAGVQRDHRFQFNFRMTSRGLLKVLLHMQKEMRQGQFAPVGFEVALSGQPHAGTVPPLQLRNGAVSCVGKIDRVDLYTNGSQKLLRVVDYKTGSKIFAPEKLAYGLDMQMLIYLFALRQSRAYGMDTPSGVLYMPSGDLKWSDYQEREKESRQAAEVLDDHYRMNGLILDTAVPFMEPEAAKIATPILADPEKGVALFTVDQTQMDALEEHVKGAVCDMADALYAGEVTPQITLNDSCQFCKCRDFCHMRDTKARTLKKNVRMSTICGLFAAPEEEDV